MSQSLSIRIPQPLSDVSSMQENPELWALLSSLGAEDQLAVQLDLAGTEKRIDAVNELFRELTALSNERGFSINLEVISKPGSLSEAEQHLTQSLQTAFADHGEDKLIINISYQCNNHCRFCAVADRPRVDGELAHQLENLRSARKRGVTLLDIDGGEPTLCGHLETLLDEALTLGYQRINLTTNGRTLSDTSYVERLSRYPIQWLVSLHGSTPALHDDLVCVPGAFRQTVKGLMNAKQHFSSVGVNTTVTAQNAEDLPRLAALVHTLGVSPWNVQVYTPFGKPDASLAVEPDRLQNALRTLLETWGERMPIQVVNAPLCLLPGLEQFGARDFFKSAREMLFVDGRDVNLADYLAEQRFKNGRCLHCEYDAVCGGFWDYGTNRQTKERYRIKLLDVIPGYACDARCVFCAVDDRVLSSNQDTQSVKEAITQAMSFGPRALRLGGGEPSLRKDFFELLAHAQTMGIEQIGVQSHGFRFADKAFLTQALDAGLTKLNLSTRGATEALHHQLTRTKDSFDKLCHAVELAARQDGLLLELDLIVLHSTMKQLAEEIRFFHGLGARRFNLWFAGIEGRLKGNPQGMVPRLSVAAPFVTQALDLEQTLEGTQVRAYYMPYCFLKTYESQVWHPLEENALVLTPNARFRLDRSSIEIGIFPQACQDCSFRARCFGINPNYVEHYGSEELRPYSGEDLPLSSPEEDET